MKFQKQSIIAIGALTMLFMSFQNCGGFKATDPTSGDAFFNSSSINPSLMCKPAEVQHATIRRLSNTELSNTLKDLLTITDDVTGELSPDGTSGEGFTNNAEVLKINVDYLKKLMPAVETALQKSVAAGSAEFKCPAAKDAACAQNLIQSFALKAFRRPPTAAELSGMNNLYTTQKAAGATFESNATLATSAPNKVPEGVPVPIAIQPIFARVGAANI